MTSSQDQSNFLFHFIQTSSKSFLKWLTSSSTPPLYLIAQVRANGSYKWKIEKLRLKGSPPLSLLRCLSGQYFESGILFISSGQLGTREERNKGCGGEPFNLNFLNCSFVGPISSYLGYTRISVGHLLIWLLRKWKENKFKT